jgi:hypothetical protein
MKAESDLGGHYKSPRLTPVGLAKWIDVLNDTIIGHDDDWLAAQLVAARSFNSREDYTRKDTGKTYSRVVHPVHAAQQLAEGEFNRYYLRGLCRRAKEAGIEYLIVYRGKAVERPRPESEAMIGHHISVDELLAALRSNDFVSIEDALKVPGGPNSGLTARLP